MSDNRFEIKIIKEADGSDANLNNLSVAAAKSLSDILSSLSRIAEYENQDGSVKISITKGSACAAIEAPEAKLTVIKNNIEKVTEYKSEDDVYIENLRKIQEVIKSNGLTYQIYLKEVNTPRIDYLDKFKQNRKFRKRRHVKKYDKRFHMEFFTGKLFAVGGKNPNIHIESAGEPYPIDCDENQAIIVNKFLYKEVRISAWTKVAENEKPKYYLCDHYINEETYQDLRDFVKYNTNLNGTEILKNIHYKLQEYLVNHDLGNARKFIRLFTSNLVDIQRQRSILIVLKEFRDHEKFQDLYDQLIALIEKETKKPVL